jgi:hypothetical protein
VISLGFTQVVSPLQLMFLIALVRCQKSVDTTAGVRSQESGVQMALYIGLNLDSVPH